MQGSGARHHHHLPQAFHELGSASNTSSNSARSFSSQSDAAEEDAHTLRQLSVLRERAGTSAAPSGEGGGWDDMQLAALTRTADILVVAVGYPELVRYAFPSK